MKRRGGGGNPLERQNFGRLIREIREAKKLTLEEVGARVGVSFQSIRAYETGRNSPKGSRLVSLADALDEPLSSFIPNAPSSPPED